MGCTCANSLSTCFFHDVGSLGDGSSCIDHVVDNHHILVFDVTDNLHGGYNVGASAGLVAENQRATQIFSIGVGALRTADIR